jgi:hypothetical protein
MFTVNIRIEDALIHYHYCGERTTCYEVIIGKLSILSYRCVIHGSINRHLQEGNRLRRLSEQLQHQLILTTPRIAIPCYYRV